MGEIKPQELTKMYEGQINQRDIEFKKGLNKEQKEFIDEVESNRGGGSSSLYRAFFDGFKAGRYSKPSQFVEDKLLWLFDGYIPKRYKEALCYAVDNSREWAYSVSYYRRSFRSNKYYMDRVFGIIYEFHRQMNIDKDVADILCLKLDEMERAFFDNTNEWRIGGMSEYAIAYELDKNNEKVMEAIEDIVNGDSELPMQRYIIRGIVRSNNAGMHELLGRLLLAARLQEGLRQSICENMDIGTVSAFLSILKVINENNLIRFSSVKRAVGTWLGLINAEAKDLERISDKSIELILACIEDRKCADEYLNTEDCMKIYIGLWAIGVRSVEEAIEIVKNISKTGTHHQVLTTGYFCANLNNSKLAHELASQVIADHMDEQDILAVYMNYFMESTTYIWNRSYEEMLGENDYIESRAEAEKFYDIMLHIYDNIKGKSVDFSPCIFPWYSASLRKTVIIEKLCRLADYINDSAKIDYVSGLLKECESDNRSRCLVILLSKPTTSLQKRVVTSMLCDKAFYTRDSAAKIVKSMKVEDENYLQMEEMLKYKSADMRSTIIGFLYEQSDSKLLETIGRLLNESKEEKRTAALDMVMQLSKDGKRKKAYEKALEYVKAVENPTSKEKVLIDNILGVTNEGQAVSRKQLYSETDKYMPKLEDSEFLQNAVEVFMRYFPDSLVGEQIYGGVKKNILSAIAGKLKKSESKCAEATKADCDSLLRLFGEHVNDEYRGYGGEISTFGSSNLNFRERNGDVDDIPGLNIWKEWYEKNIASAERLYRMYILIKARGMGMDFDDEVRPYIVQIFGAGFEQFYQCDYRSQIKCIISRLMEEYGNDEEQKLLSVAAGYWYVKCLPQDKVLITAIPPQRMQSWCREKEAHFVTHNQLCRLFGRINCKNDEFFDEVFPLSTLIAQKTFARAVKMDENARGYYYGRDKKGVTGPNNYEFLDGMYSEPGVVPHIIAAYRGLITREAMYEYMFRTDNLADSFEAVTLIGSGFREMDRQVAKRGGYGWWRDNRRKLLMQQFMEDEGLQKFVDGVYDELVNEVLSVELKRGDSETIYSKDISNIRRIYGIDNFIRILIAMGKDTLERSTYYSSGNSKRSSMSHLLSVCIPYETDTVDKLEGALAKTDIKQKRLIEAAFYSPEWINIVGEYLGYDGFKSACYYFMAHMNERFDDIRKAIIAKYTPLSDEELNAGAFDINWFKSAYEEMGEKRFNEVYDAAKYISDGAKHSRARKYADATLGRMYIDDVEDKISDKRNKDLVMAYSLIPLAGEDDVIRRYLYLQKFLKESKKFGAQRIASEKKAVEISMSNLAMNAGYSDVTRLTLRMETKLIDDIRELFEERQVEDVTVRLQVDDDGKAEIVCMKAGKSLKSVPVKLKKNEYIVRLNDSKKMLNEQFKRTKLMFEQAMEDETEFSVEEIRILHKNPVANAVVKSLVFMCGDRLGFIVDNILVDWEGCEYSLSDSDKVRVAHPYHIYKDGHWVDYQKNLFDKQIKQVFKQVFRELYVKTEEELEMNYSRRYSGNQIQPQKTVACLKGRRWVADVEDGLQKIYYKENIVARIYAMADWFSPSDIEAPTLEWVEFSDRRTGKEIKIKDVPDVIFSEIMRDVDLAVSVAHAGGVDPETSHSTVEMRAALITFTLPLFKLTNVKINKNHAIVDGHYGTYDINLGSGVIHKQGGAMINVLPVHSQHRGKIFLPFADDDPKTAEIMTKVIMFAEDKKIKDVSILEQIR